MQAELDLPSREKPTRKSFPTSLRSVRRWRDDIEAQEVREATRRFCEGLHALNRLVIPPRRRLRIMELLRPTAREILDHLAGRIQAQTLPLPERTRKVFQLNLDLLAEVAGGYASVLADSAGGKATRRIAAAAQRALAAQGEHMLRCAQVYAPLEPDFWARVNATYAHAEAAGAADRAVRDTALGPARRGRETPRQAYVRLLMFALAGTQGVRKGEAERIHTEIATWCRQAWLGPATDLDGSGDPDATPDCRFLVDLAQAAPPVPWSEPDAEAPASLRALELRDVVARLEQVAIERDAPESPLAEQAQMGPRTLQRLLGNWRHRTVARSERAEREASVDVEITLASIQARMDATERPAPPEKPGRQASAATLELQTIERDEEARQGEYVTHPGYDVDGPAGANWEAIERGHIRSPGFVQARAEAEARERQAASPDRPDWRLGDVSRTGFRLRWEGDGASRAVVGELVAVLVDGARDKTPKWRIGVIRWMQFLDETRFEIGVHALGARVGAATVRREPANRNRKRKRAQEAAEPALLLPGSRSGNRAATVLVPAHMFQRGEIVELDVRERVLRIELGAVRENTGSFAQFEIAPAPRRGRSAAGGGKSPGGADAPVWDSL